MQHTLIVASRVQAMGWMDRLLDVLAHLPTVRSLWITNTDFEQNAEHFKSFVNGFKSVDTLVLQSVIFRGEIQEGDFIELFPKLEKILAFGRCRHIRPDRRYVRTIPHLQHLCIDIGESCSLRRGGGKYQ